jgi:hypothetical protein
MSKKWRECAAKEAMGLDWYGMVVLMAFCLSRRRIQERPAEPGVEDGEAGG